MRRPRATPCWSKHLAFRQQGTTTNNKYLPSPDCFPHNWSLCWEVWIGRKGQLFIVLTIRLSRRGARKQPHYRIVVIEKERARDGRALEVVGIYNPRTNSATVEVKRDRVDYWRSKGAQVSSTVGRLLAKAPAGAETAA